MEQKKQKLIGMLSKTDLIFIIEDDIPFGNLILSYIQDKGYENAVLFHEEKLLLNNLNRIPSVIIADYHLKTYSGLKLIRMVKDQNLHFRSVLLSGAYHVERFNDEDSIQLVDKYIKKSETALEEIVDTLNSWIMDVSVHSYF